MTTETKSGEECSNCEGTGNVTFFQADCGECPTCEGLGKVFAPGDALTAKEAWTLSRDSKNGDVQERLKSLPGIWRKFNRAMVNGLSDNLFEFRLAPAPQEELANLKCVHTSDEEHGSFL